jgi:hypothetical protein
MKWLCIPLLLPLVAAQQPARSPKHLCEVTVASPAELARLFDVASDPDDHARSGERARIYADSAEVARLSALGFEVTVVQRDLATFYARRAAAAPNLALGAGSMGGFRTLAEIVSELDRLTSTYPSIVSPKYSIGTSVQGRPIYAIRISDNPGSDDPLEPVAWFDALHHAREPMSGEAMLRFADHLGANYLVDADVKRMVDTRNIVIVPCVNPDGYEFNRETDPGGGGLWRKNRRNNGDSTFGVDLNRNYGWEWGGQWSGSSGVTGDETYRGPSEFSEPESRAVRDQQLAHPPGMALSAHTYSDLMLYPWGYDKIVSTDDAQYRWYGEQMTAANSWPFGTSWQILYLANGVSSDWTYGALGTFAFSPEIGSGNDGFWPAPARIEPLFESVLPALTQVAQWSGGWIETTGEVWKEVQGDGDDDQEPGEVWDLEFAFANPGVAAARGIVRLTSSHPEVHVVHGVATFRVPEQTFRTSLLAAPAPPHAPTKYQPIPLRLAFPANAADGVYDVDASFAYDGASTADAVTVKLGTPRVLSHDDMEIAAFGWQAADATNYSWQRAVPQVTTSGSETAQPGNDNPAGSGTMCWVTGAAAGSAAGTNDVDGTTVLTSPVFRASGFAHLELEYARWFANLLGSAQDDHFVAEVSNNGGGSWVMLESSPNANAWQTALFSLEDFVTLTDAMRLRVTIADVPNNDLTEAALDDVVLRTLSHLPTLGAWGPATAGSSARLFVDGPPSVAFTIRRSVQSSAGVTVSGAAGLSYLDGSVQDVASGTTDANGRARITWTVAAGSPLYLQAVYDEGGPQAAFSNLLTLQ